MDQFIVEVSSEEDARIIKGIISQFKSARLKSFSQEKKLSIATLPVFTEHQLQKEVDAARRQVRSGKTISLDAFMKLRQQWLKELRRSGNLN